MKNKSNNSSLILWIFALLILVGAFAFAARPSWSTMTNLINNTKALKNLQTPNNFSWFKIDTAKWNNLMEYLDQFSWYIAEYEGIKELPVWIVLPFDSSRGCPEGGERRVYSPAIWRFIKWTSVAQEIGTYTWDASNWTWNIALSINNIPEHNHGVKIKKGAIWWVVNWTNFSTDWYEMADNMWPNANNDTPTPPRTDNTWWWNNITILNSYLKLIYCEKYK